MSKCKLFTKLCAACALVVLGGLAVFAQKKGDPKPQPTVDPSEKVRNVKPEPNNAYKKFLNEDAIYIATPDEIKAFKALRTDEERENFIHFFWGRRDPDPDTEENEFRDQHFERIAYANEHFTSGTPGWRTDRGKIYIMWGKPDSVESHPSGGSYDRPSYEGGGSTSTYPFETWIYRHLDGVGDGVEVEFVDPTGTGEYRMAKDADEKDALKYIPNAGQTSAELMGLSSKADRGLSNAQQSFQRFQDSPFERLEIQKGLMNPPALKFGDLDQIVSVGAVIDGIPLSFDLRIDFFRQSDDRVVTAFTVQTNNKELQFKDVGGLDQAQMNIFGRITAVSDKRSGTFEDSVSTSATPVELSETRDRKSVYQKAIALTPGIYKVAVVVRDVNSGKKGVQDLGFTVPKFDDKKLATSSLVLASKLRATNDRDIGAPFVIGGTKVVPNLSGVFKQGSEVGIYMQIYNVGIDQTTLRPAVDVDYVILKDGKEVFRQQEDWKGLSDSGQRLTLARLLPTTVMPLGDYELRVIVKDRVGSQVIENKGKFTISAN